MSWYEENKRTAWLLAIVVLIVIAFPFRAKLLPGYFGTQHIGGEQGKAAEVYLDMQQRAVAPLKAELDALRSEIEAQAANGATVDPALLKRQDELSVAAEAAMRQEYGALDDTSRHLLDKHFPEVAATYGDGNSDTDHDD